MFYSRGSSHFGQNSTTRIFWPGMTKKIKYIFLFILDQILLGKFFWTKSNQIGVIVFTVLIWHGMTQILFLLTCSSYSLNRFLSQIWKQKRIDYNTRRWMRSASIRMKILKCVAFVQQSVKMLRSYWRCSPSLKRKVWRQGTAPCDTSLRFYSL